MSALDTVFVLVPIPTAGPYSYAVPQGMFLATGDLVKVPLGSRTVTGAVWEGGKSPVDRSKLRQVIEKHDCPPLANPMRAFVEWVANYTLSPPGMVLRMVINTPTALQPPAPVEGFKFSDIKPERMTRARNAVMAFAGAGLPWTRSGLAHAAGVSASVVAGLARLGVLERVILPAIPLLVRPDVSYSSPELTGDQQRAANSLRSLVQQDQFNVTLLEGVTGSGKTEVYFEALAACFAAGRQALILLPEIALTATFMQRFEQRFGVKPAEWHSEVSPKTREKTWRQIANAELQVVAGARSALFLPFRDLGLIIVDEEHDQAYKQEDRVFYNARDMAVVRGQTSKFPIVLCSATPSLESRVNANLDRYKHLRLEQRFGEAQLPELRVIDMRRDAPPRGKFLSPVMCSAIGKTLARKEQVLLFLNRRGYAPLTLCRVCGYRFECNNCSAWLVEHRFHKQLQCHHCGETRPSPDHCPQCGTFDHLAACGPGVERLAEEVNELFPEARSIVLSSDLSGGVKRMRAELEAIAGGEADIVVGTQLVAKGHNFPMMTLVGVVDADLGLANGDPRAAERTFQLLNQVTGRAGRAGGKSCGLLQSYQPDHPVIAAIIAGDREAFYAREIEARRLATLPPFGRLAAIIISAATSPEARAHANAVRKMCPARHGVRVLGPAEAALAMVRSRYRFRLLVHTAREIDIQNYLRNWLGRAPKPRGSVRVQIDVDPQSFM